MANEQQKFREAAYFFGVMKLNVEDRTAFIYNFSAFINAARTVVQYAAEECGPPPSSARSWYDNYVAGSELIRYFRDKRNLNIHDEPVIPNAAFSVSASSNLSIGGTVNVSVVSTGADGNVIRSDTPASDAAQYAISAPNPSTQSDKPTVRYFLADRPNEDLIDLSQDYLNALLAFLATGRREGHIPAD